MNLKFFKGPEKSPFNEMSLGILVQPIKSPFNHMKSFDSIRFNEEYDASTSKPTPEIDPLYDDLNNVYPTMS